MSTDSSMPARPFFNCTAEEFAIIDGSAHRASLLHSDTVVPWVSFKRGPGNIFETSPRRVIKATAQEVAVECEDGVVYLNFADGTARKVTAQGEFVYMGGVDEGNQGRGYIPVH